MEKVEESWSERTLRWKVPADARFKAIYIKLKKKHSAGIEFQSVVVLKKLLT